MVDPMVVRFDAIDSYRRGMLDEAGGYLSVPRNNGEADADYNARLRAALALPDWVPTPLPLPGMTGTLEAKPEKQPEPEVEPEDNPEPEDEEDDEKPTGGRHKRTRR